MTTRIELTEHVSRRGRDTSEHALLFKLLVALGVLALLAFALAAAGALHGYIVPAATGSFLFAACVVAASVAYRAYALARGHMKGSALSPPQLTKIERRGF